ncbi:MAG: haloacid dehalogenase [Phototrophicaceae bacterium]
MHDQLFKQIIETIRADMNQRSDTRDMAIARSRELIRQCAECIRAIHRQEWDVATDKLDQIQTIATNLQSNLAPYPDLYHAGYTQDALKEMVEAYTTYAIIRNQPLPTPQDLHVPSATYLNGLAEAATELRRFILDIMRKEVQHSPEAERLLGWMDAIYDELVAVDFPDAITNGLRRQTDIVRGVLERTRGDLTNSLRQQQLQEALLRLEQRLHAPKESA